jgi:uncharacterized protein (UPF0147 family)
MLRTNQETLNTCPALLHPELDELISDGVKRNALTEFRERMSNLENKADEMLTRYAEALSAVESLSLSEFVPDWRENMLTVVQMLFTLPRRLLHQNFPEEYESLEEGCFDFLLESDPMGEDMLEFMIALERHDLDEASDLFTDLHEGLEKLETLLTTRWREIARLSRELETSNKLAERWPVPVPVPVCPFN